MKSKIGVFVVLMLFYMGTVAGVTTLLGESANVYSVLEKAFYLSAEEAAVIRPGLNLQIGDVSIPANRKPVVTFRITDDSGQGLDRQGNDTLGTVSTSFILAYLPQNSAQYVSHTTRVQTSPINGVRETQAAADSGGVYASQGDGRYTYTFGTTLPSNYDTTTTHTVGIYATRDLRDFGLSRYVSNEVKNFVPDGRQVEKIREVVRTESCNNCHDPLEAHGGARQKIEICILCHTPQTKDPDTGNTVDMAVMVHKIHRGAELPSVVGGTPYIIIGNNQSVNDFSDVHFPRDIRNCVTCHKDSAQVNNWLLKPNRASCGSCHDDINWTTGENHAAGPQADDTRCASCHQPQGEFEYDASISGAHTVPYKSTQLKGVLFEITGVSNTGPGQRPLVQFKVTNNAGSPIAPSAMNSLNLTMAGPTSDYRWYLRESATGATVSNNVATYAFTGALPANAAGTYTIMIEGYVDTILNPGTKKEFSYRDAGDNKVHYFAVSGPLTPRRTVVEIARCNNCHENLQLHGNNRNEVVACVICHNPTNTDVARRPAAAHPPEAIDFKWMIHKIHTGDELNYDYTVYGFGNAPFNFNGLRFPGDRRNCLTCHAADTYLVPLPSSATPVTTPRNFWNPTLPTAAACLGCHDSLDAAAHAFVNTAPFGESCAVCHKESALAAVSKAHAR